KEDDEKEDDEKEDDEKEEEQEEDRNTIKKQKGGKLSYDSIYVCKGGTITNQTYTELFRGWGFTFL
ncbi:MAG: hypothetical protein CMG46_02850, partial [Candidatus Marinimicrobia bacterium]|nr:hypothetical protein [Candidatus Neomarinimicrobiota bacterium]